MEASPGWQDRAIRTAYFIRIPNVGDLINPSLVAAMTGCAACHAAGREAPHLLAVGSVMSTATPTSQVWGSGVMHPDFGIGGAPASNIHALRGKLSHAAMRLGGVPVGDMPLGDPGYLAPRLLGFERSPAPKARVGVVAHYVDRHHPLVRGLLSEPGVVDLNVHAPPDVFLGRMADCATVISSSLHGLVFAEALGIPNLWITASDDIAGGVFKFQDWFSTSRRPQAAPHRLASGDTAEALARRAEVHESAIDSDALAAAFPFGQIEELQRPPGRRLMPVETCRSQPTPVVLISFNRGAMLKRAIAGIRGLRRPTVIIVHDNGSTDPATLAVLDDLGRDGIRVFRYPAITSADELNRVDETVQAYFANWAEPARYVVSDCDVDLSVADPDTLDVYDALLNMFRRAECVGPMLRIRDIPHSYPLYNRVMNRHIEQFWQYAPTVAATAFGQAAILECPIDTTFALHRAGEAFRRLKSGLRVYEPFEALHLDWYLTDADGPDVYTTTSNPTVSHWNNAAEFAHHRDVALDYADFHAVKKAPGSSALQIYKERLAPPGVTLPSVIPSFASATAAQRAARVAHVEALRSGRSSDVARWAEAGNHNDDWRSRGMALARLAKPGERVFEFGAGRSAVRESLPPGCAYTASDVVAPLTADAIFYDLNAPTLASIDGQDLALFSGVLEYVHDLERAAHFLAATFAAVACSYATCDGGSPEEIERRRYSGWFTDATEAAFTALFTSVGFTETHRGRWGSQTLFRFDR